MDHFRGKMQCDVGAISRSFTVNEVNSLGLRLYSNNDLIIGGSILHLPPSTSPTFELSYLLPCRPA